MNNDTHDELSKFMAAVIQSEAAYKRVLVTLDSLNFRVSVLYKRDEHDEPFPFFEGVRRACEAHAVADNALNNVRSHLVQYWRAHLRLLGKDASPATLATVLSIAGKYNYAAPAHCEGKNMNYLMDWVAYLNLGHLTELELLTEVHRALLEGGAK